MDQVTPRDLRTRGRRPSRTATAGVFRASDGSGTHVPRRSAGRCGMEVWLRRAEPSSELGYYERRAGRRRTSGWCTWSRAFSESWSVEAGRQPARRRRPAPLHGQFSQAHLPHLPAHEGERSTQDEAALRGGRGASSDSPHHLRRAILLIRLAGGQGRRAISSEAKQRGAKGSGGGQGRRQESRRGRRAP